VTQQVHTLLSYNNHFRKRIHQVSEPGIFAAHTRPATCASRQRRQQINVCFFFSINSGNIQFLTTESLSHCTFVHGSIGAPITHHPCATTPQSSPPPSDATNSEPKVLDSTAFCHFEHHTIGTQFTKTITPACDRCVARRPVLLSGSAGSAFVESFSVVSVSVTSLDRDLL